MSFVLVLTINKNTKTFAALEVDLNMVTTSIDIQSPLALELDLGCTGEEEKGNDAST